jgi:hypothetical protein
MTTLAPHTFWLDGGYDRPSVEACPYHPAHKWWTFRLGDVLQAGVTNQPNELMVICQVRGLAVIAEVGGATGQLTLGHGRLAQQEQGKVEPPHPSSLAITCRPR